MSTIDTVKRETKNIRRSSRLSLWNSRFLWHNQLLGQRLYLFSLVRFLAAAGIIVGAFFAKHVVGIEGLRTLDLSGCGAFLAAYNVAVLLLVRPFRDPEQVERGYRRLNRIAHTSITIDYLVLTYAIWLVGGGRSPFLAFYLLHAILASILLTRRSAFAQAAIGYLLLAGIVIGEWMQWIPRNFPQGAVFGGSDRDIRPILTVLFVYGLLIATATYLMTGIAWALRAGDKRLREASESLEDLADLRRAFLHVVLHDLHSPVSTVVSLLETLSAGVAGPLTDLQKEWVVKGEGQLKRLLGLLHDLQILTELETGDLNAVMEPVNISAALGEVVEDYLEAAKQRGIKLKAEVPETIGQVRGIDRLIREAIANYITNAIKYTQAGGLITVGASRQGSAIRMEVVDNGPGISDFNQKRLFREFVRVRAPAEKGSIRPPGSGLGLSIVRRIAEVHNGSAGVSSQLGKGSTFFIELPALDSPAPTV